MNGGVAADRLICVASNEHELSGGSRICAIARLPRSQILAESQEIKTAWQNQAFREAVKLMPRRQREEVYLFACGGGNRTGEQRRLASNIRIDEAQPFCTGRNRARADPAGMRLADPVGRQRRAGQNVKANTMLGQPRGDGRRVVRRVIVDDEYLHLLCRMGLRNEGRNARTNIAAFVAHREYDRDLRLRPDRSQLGAAKRTEQSILTDCARDQPGGDRQPCQGDGQFYRSLSGMSSAGPHATGQMASGAEISDPRN